MVNTKQSPFSKTGVKSNHLSRAMTWRCIGPFRGGRVIAVAGHPTNQSTFFFGSVAGGVWKTTDAGTYWKNISDPYFTTSSVGAIAISESDPNVIYVGTGECCIRNNVTHGDGVYKSTTTVDCENGFWRVGRIPIRDDHPHKLITVSEVIKYSSNIWLCIYYIWISKCTIIHFYHIL